MKLLFDARTFVWAPATGVSSYALNSLRELAAQRPESQLIGFFNASRGVPPPPFQAPNVRWVNRGWSNRLMNARTILGVAPKMDQALGGGGGAKTLHATSLLWLPNINYASWSSSVPMVLTIHDLAFMRMPEVYNAKWQLWHKLVRPKMLARRAAAIIVPSQATAEDVQELMGIPAERIHVIPHGVNGGDGADVLGNDGGSSEPVETHRNASLLNGIRQPYLLYVGTIEPRKNVEAIVDAFGRVRQRHPNLSLVLAGPWGWKTSSVRRAIDRSPARESIRVLSYVSEDQRRQLYRGAAALVWPSWYEGFGFPVLEAMAEGCPVVAGATSSLFEVAGDAALLVRPYDQAGLVQAIENVLSDERLAAMLRERGLERVKSFTWKAAAGKMWEVFEGVLRENKSRG
jgi:glycosyltransferase involved in cell wall biosynthesis